MASDYTFVTIDGQYTTLADVGEYFFTIKVNSATFTWMYEDYSFKVVLSACYAT
jgi:hypothetical protein